MKLSPTDELTVVDRRLEVNGRPFQVRYPDEPLLCTENGRLVTIVFRGCGCTLSQWEPGEIEGNYI